MKAFSAQGIILSTKVMFETDKRVELFSPTLGRVSLLAKHACRSRRRFGGTLEPPHLVSVGLYSGSSFYLVQYCDLITSFSTIRTHYNLLQMMGHLFDIIRKSTASGQAHPTLFNLLSETLELLCHSPNPIDVITDFYIQFLSLEGILDSPVPHTLSFRDFQRLFQPYSGKALSPLQLLDGTRPY